MSMGSGGDCWLCRWVVVEIVRGVDGLWWRLFVVSTGSGEDCSWCRWIVVEIVRGVDG